MPPALLDGISLPVLELTAGPALLDGISLPVLELTAGVSVEEMEPLDGLKIAVAFV